MYPRRAFVVSAACAASLALASHAPCGAAEASKRTRLVLLGTAGGPRPRKSRAACAQAIVVGDSIYVIDCGNGVARQIVSAGFELKAIRAVFITHHHSDHNADYGNLLLLAWTAGLRTPVDTYGPPPLENMTRLFFEMNAVDMEARMTDEKRVPLVPLIHAHDISSAGKVFEQDGVRVTSALVDHPPMATAFAYRFDTPDRSIVISGDTRYSERLIELATGADVLVHEVVYPEAIDRLGDAMWLAPIQQHFKGRVVLGTDLMIL